MENESFQQLHRESGKLWNINVILSVDCLSLTFFVNLHLVPSRMKMHKIIVQLLLHPVIIEFVTYG